MSANARFLCVDACPQNKTIADLSEDAIRDAAQWCKQGSIDGCKKPSVVIIYTPWSNLRKEASMAVRFAVDSSRSRGRYACTHQ
ncbi:hypothetical protein EON67_02805 [archaeon]|nr:MAG: hypothetical protein EON67_02805 [archaeon]